MSIIPNYLALYNLSQIEADILIVSDLTATTGTIYILNSTTGTITTLNSTTGNITTLNSTNVNVSSLTPNKIVLSNGSKNLVSSLYNDTDFARLTAVNIFTNNNTIQGSLSCNDIRSIAPHTANVNLFPLSTGTINIGLSVGGGNINLNSNTVLGNNKNLELSGSAKITTPAILVSGLTGNKIVLTDASDNLISSSYTDTDFARLIANNVFTGNNTFRNTTISPTYVFTTSFIRPQTVSDNLQIGDNSTSGVFTIGNTNPALDSGTIVLNRSTSLGSGKNLTLQGTGGINLNTGTIDSNGNISTASILLSNTIRARTVGSQVNIFDTSGAQINFGNGASAFVILFNQLLYMNGKNITIVGASNKITTPNITLSGTQTASKLLLTDSSKNIVSSLYDETTLPVSTPTQTALNLKANIDNPTFTGVITAPEIRCPLYNSTNATTLLEIGKSSTSADIYLGQAQTSGNIQLGNLTSANDSGGLTINKFTTLATGKSLTLSSTSNFISNNIRGTAIGTSVNIYPSTTTGSITVGGALTTGSINLGVIGMSGKIGCNSNVEIGTSANNKGISCNYYQSFTNSSIVQFCRNLTTGELRIAPEMTTGIIYIGNVSVDDVGTLNIRRATTLEKSLTISSSSYLLLGNLQLSSGTILCNSIDPFIFLNPFQFCPNITTGSVLICEAQTSGAIQIGNSVPANDSGTLTINKNTSIATGKNLNIASLTASKIVLSDGSKNLISSVYTDTDFVLKSGSTMTGTLNINNIQGTTTTSAISLFTNTAGANVSLATGLTTGTLFIGPTVATSNLAYPQGWTVLNADTYLISGRELTIDAGSLLFSPMISNANGTFNICCETIDVSNVINIGTKSNNVNSNVNIGNTTAASDFGKVQMNKNLIMGDTTFGGSKTISSNWYYGLSSTSNIALGGGTTSGVVNIGDSSSVTPFTGGTFNNGPFSVCRYLAGTRRFSYINVGFGNNTTPTLFKTTPLVGKFLTSTMYANAGTSEWCAFESDTGNEGSAFIQNGDTSCVINPGDQFALWWLDEDAITTNTTYAWSGWKISTAGVFTTSSDRRLKRDITPIVDVGILDKLSLLEMVNYKWKAPTEEKYYKNGVLRRKYQEIHTGYIAQDVRQVFPDVVERENADAYWTIKREDLSAKYHLGVLELIKQNKAQQIQIDNNKILIDDLTARLARLEQILLNQ